jgi:small-conductance mechanosensitive channel/CRP-like cAMP-binding protein
MGVQNSAMGWLLLGVGGPLLFGVMVFAGHWLRSRHGWRLGPMFQFFALSLSVLICSSFGKVDLPWGEHLAPATIVLSCFFIVPAIDRFVWRGYFQQYRQVKIPVFLTQVAALLLFLVVVLLVLAWVYDFPIRGVLTGSGVAAVILGLAMQDLLGNMFACFAILFGKPFRVGDWLVVDGSPAEVVEINWRSTRLRNNDNIYLDVPNNNIIKQTIKNLSYPTALHAMRLQLGLDYAVPPNEVKEVLKQAVRSATGVCPEPEPRVFLQQFADSAIVYQIKFWMEDQARFSEIQDAIHSRVWYALNRRGIRIPFPTHTVQLERSSPSLETEQRRMARAVLRHRSPFQCLDDEQLDQMLARARTLRFGIGERIIQQGDPGESMFILLSGEADVFASRDGVAAHLATLSGGDCFGEMSLLTGEPRSATVSSRTDLETLEVGKPLMAEILVKHPELLQRLSELLAQRRLENEGLLAEASRATTLDRRQEYARGFLKRLKVFFNL